MSKSKTNLIITYKEAELAEEKSREIADDAWKRLRTMAARANNPDDFVDRLRSLEDDYMETMYAGVPEAKWPDGHPKAGEWKYRKFNFKSNGKAVTGGLPMAYLSAKSTLKVALEHEIEVKGASKDVVTKANAAAKSVQLSAFQKARNHLEQVVELWPQLSAEERDAIRTDLLPKLDV